MESVKKSKKAKEGKWKFEKGTKEDFDAIYDYIRYDLLGYEPRHPLPGVAISKIERMVYGVLYKEIPKNSEPTVIYTYNIILETLIQCSSEITTCLRSMTFKNDTHKINTIFMILDKHIYSIKMSINKKIEKDAKIDTEDTSYLTKERPDYVPQGQIKERFKDML